LEEENLGEIQEDEGKKVTNKYVYVPLVNYTTEKTERRKKDASMNDTITN
jgi:hypothetical protein